MADWRFVILAPDVGLQAASAEISAIVAAGNRVDLIHGALTPADVAARLAGTKANVLFVVSHGYESGILLSRHVSTEPPPNAPNVFDLTNLPKSTKDKFDLVVLNTCSSDKVARKLQNDMRAAIVCTTLAIDDAAAATFGGDFARYLMQASDPTWAYDMARPGNNDQYMYLAAVSEQHRDFLAAGTGR